MDGHPSSNTPGLIPMAHAPFPARFQYRNQNHPVISHRTAEEAEQVLQNLRNETGYQTVEETGLRRLICPSELLPDGQMVQQRGCEIFLGRLPKDLLEDEIHFLCKPFGTIREIRLMLVANPVPNRMHWNRGYAFVLFKNQDEARSAIEHLDRKEIRPGFRIGVKKSVDNCRLFVGGLPRDKTQEEFETEIRKQPCCAGLRRVIMYPAVADKTKNRGFAFVEFASHRDAAIARRQLMREKVALWGKEICVDWAQPEPEVDQSVMQQVRVAYVRNLAADTTENDLFLRFSSVAQDGEIEKIKKVRDFAFIHFQARSDAQRAIDHLNGTEIDGCHIEVMWGKPPSARHRQQQQNFDFPLNGAMHESPGWHPNPLYRHPINSAHAHAELGARMQFFPLGQVPVYPRNFMQPPQRHYRNAAGTRRRYGRSNGMQTLDYHDGFEVHQMHSHYNHGNGEGYAPYVQDSTSGFAPYYNPGLFYPPHSNFPSHMNAQHYPQPPQNNSVNPEMVPFFYAQFQNLSLVSNGQNGHSGEISHGLHQPHLPVHEFPNVRAAHIVEETPVQD